MEKRLITALLFVLTIPGLLHAQEAGIFSLWPGAPAVEPRQRSLTSIVEIPTREDVCPVCGRTVHVPLVDALMYKPEGADAPPRWRMHADRRDSDMAPVPGKNKLSWQADIVTCPECGLSLPVDVFAEPVPDDIAQWAREALQPNLRTMQTALLGPRAAHMSETQIIDFFNRQEEIPDIIRTEHYRIYAIAANRPYLEQARAAWLTAWAFRRQTTSLRTGAFLAKRQQVVEAMLAEKKAVSHDQRVGELRHLLGKTKAGKDRLPYHDQVAARLLLASEYVHAGLYTEATDIIERILTLVKDRFLKPEQDPLWVATTKGSTKAYRLNELESIRTDVENELSAVLGYIILERGHLLQAAILIREAIEADEITDPDVARFYAYMVGEMLRRYGQFPLAAEWFRNLRNLAPAGTPLADAAERQLVVVQKQAGDVNLLAALGQDGELFEKLREICLRHHAEEKTEG